jgi:hypothetical protein
MSELIVRFRQINRGKPVNELVDNYYFLLDKIQQYKKNKDFNKMLENCQMSLPLIEPLIVETKRQYKTFDISSIPAIEIGSTFWAIYGDEVQLNNIKEIVYYFPELEPWKEEIDNSYYIKDLASKIYNYVKENPGVEQKSLKKMLNVDDGRIIANVCYYMELTNKLKRRKVGNTYNLTII